MSFESQKISARNMVLSPNKQLAYAAALADANLTRRVRFDGSGFAEITQERRSDLAMAGKGTEFATDGQIISRMVNLGGTVELTDWVAGWLFAFLMGKETVVGAGPYTHTFGFDESTTQAPATTVYVEDTADVHSKYLDLSMTDLNLSFPDRGSIQAQFSMVGTGRFADGSMAALPALPAAAYLLGSDSQFLIGVPGAAAALESGRFLGGTMKISTQTAAHRAPGGGLYGVFNRVGTRKISYQFSIAAKDVDDVRTLFLNDTEREIQINTNSGAAAQLNIKLPSTKFTTTKAGANGTETIWQIESDETSIYNKAGAGPVIATVINGQAAYLVGA